MIFTVEERLVAQAAIDTAIVHAASLAEQRGFKLPDDEHNERVLENVMRKIHEATAWDTDPALLPTNKTPSTTS
jgi:hypothetical protein